MTKKKLIEQLSYDRLKEVIEAKEYRFFDNGKFNVNLVGIRFGYDVKNDWDDVFAMAYRNAKGLKKIMIVDEFTTLPGVYYTKKKLLNENGVAILPEGQHRGLFRIGKHRRKYLALTQRRDVSLWRDNNKDNVFEAINIDSGMFGINFHHGYDSEEINKMSAGCQVIKDNKFFEAEFMPVIKKGKDYHGNSFTYTLLNAKDFE